MVGVQAIRGMYDILPPETVRWRYLSNKLAELALGYGYQEIRFPIVEQTALFKRGIGEATDVVEKEMYTFEDRNGDSLSLRPEGTASCVRAVIEHGLIHNQIQRLWYTGPMFRHERPQKGRCRQFHHFGVEAFGISTPDIDAELILMTARMWEELGLKDRLILHLNSLGLAETRIKYRTHLVEYFTQHRADLDEDSLRRLTVNPLRILDSKNPDMQSLIAGAPLLTEHLDKTSELYFSRLCHLLDKAGIHYKINPRLVRGLDYYCGTVFEWISDELGSQSAVCAGGRYDNLVELLGGKPTPAIGFAIGMERVIALLETSPVLEDPLSIYCILVGEAAEERGLILAEEWRRVNPQIRVLVNCGGGSFKTQFKRADKSGALLAFILGDDELKNNTISVKFLREERPQQSLSLQEVQNFINTIGVIARE